MTKEVEIVVSRITEKGYAFGVSTYDGTSVFINHYIANALELVEGDRYLAKVEENPERSADTVVSMVLLEEQVNTVHDYLESESTEDPTDPLDGDDSEKEYSELLTRLKDHAASCKTQAGALQELAKGYAKQVEEAEALHAAVLDMFGEPQELNN